MNLNAYDELTEKVNKSKSWIDIKRRRLLSREIKYRKYCIISKRYDTKTKSYLYYIILLDDIPENRKYQETKIDNYGRIKIKINELFSLGCFAYNKDDFNVDINLIETADDGDIYQIDV